MMHSASDHHRPNTNKCNTLGETSIATLLFGLFLLIAGAALLITALSTGRHQAANETPADQIDSAGDR
tara:strand:- start:1124 stop:1327 length:204 start_codon:yes stop_codon:yes gene_type:complete